MHPEATKELGARFKYVVLDYAKHVGVTKACREFDVPRSSFYNWKKDMMKKARQVYTQRNLPPKVIHE
jgi:ACT domain-containing protein